MVFKTIVTIININTSLTSVSLVLWTQKDNDHPILMVNPIAIISVILMIDVSIICVIVIIISLFEFWDLSIFDLYVQLMLDNDTREIETCCKIQLKGPCLNRTGVHQNLGVYLLISFNLQPTGVEENFLPFGWKTTMTSNDPIFQYSNVQKFQYSNVPMFQCSNVKMCKCSNV